MSGILPRRIAFWYPSRAIGGAESLLVRVAKGLAEKNVECRLWDYADGIVPAMLRAQDVPFRLAACDELGMPPVDAAEDLGEDDLLVVFQTHLFKIPLLPPARCRLLVWEVHNGFWTPGKPGAKERLKRARCSELLRLGGLATIEPGSFARMRLAGIDGPPPPRIPISVDPSPVVRPARHHAPVVFAGLGRASRDKIAGPAWAFARLAASRPDARFAYLADNPGRAREIWRRIDPVLAERVEFPEGATGAAAQRWLVEHADVCLSMGASALDAAKHGIPTVIVDSCESGPYPEAARVRLLWENAGHDTVAATPSTEHGRTPEEAVAIIATDPAAAGAASAEYVSLHHSGHVTVEKLIETGGASRVLVEDFAADPAAAAFARKEWASMRRRAFRKKWTRRIVSWFRPRKQAQES